MSIATGTKLGQYEVQDFLGQGAMGVVYRAYHEQLERTGAVKVMQAITPDTDSVARFRHEAQAIAKMRHPNIVDVYDFGEYEGTPYMIVEYVAGGSLASRMARGRLDQETALKYLRGIAAGLDYAHAHGVVHRDVKPANVLLTADDQPVLADFGLAKLLQGSSLKSMTGVTTGTPAYMAPEQVTGGKVSPASDRYSLATIAYEMLTGVIPFDGEALMELLYAQVHREPVPPSSRYPDLGAQVDAVIMRGLAKDPAARWESSTAFVDALAAALAATPAEKAVAARPRFATTLPLIRPAAAVKAAPRTEVMPRPAAVAPTAPMPAARPQPKQRHWLRRAAILAGALLLLVVLFGVCQALAAPTLTLNPTSAAPGQEVRVSATHVPANQPGTIEVHSIIHAFPFRADGAGRVNTYIQVPRDIAFGDHTVSLCWNSACHVSAPLRVTSGTGLVLPTPAGNFSPSASPSPGGTPRPTPRVTPTPTSGSGGGGSGGSGSTPTPAPTKPPTPPPTVNPCPGNSSALVLSPSSQSVVGGNRASFSGSNFTPYSSVTLSYYAPQSSSTATSTWSVTALCDGSFSTGVTTKSGLVIRTDKVVACDIRKGCATATITVLLV